MDEYEKLGDPQDGAAADRTEPVPGEEEAKNNPMERMRVRMAADGYNSIKRASMDTSTDDGFGLPKKKSGIEKALCLVLVLCIFVIVALVIGIIVVAAKNSEFQDECHSPECVVLAGKMVASMKPESDPCDDFYEYACGSYVKSHIIPPDKKKYGTLNSMDFEGKNAMSHMLEEEGGDFMGTNSSAITKVREYYKSCMNYSATQSQGIGPAMELINHLGGWPVLSTSSWNPSVWNLEQAFLKSYLLGSNPVMGIGVEPDLKDSKVRRIIVTQVSTILTLGDYGLYVGNKTSDMKKAYTTFYIRVATLLGANQNDAKSAANDVWEFEKALAGAFEPHSNRTDPFKYYHLTTLQKFQQETLGDSINLSTVLNGLFENISRIEADEPLLILAKEYLGKAAILLKTAKTSPQLLANYMVFRSLLPYIDEMPLEFGIALQQLEHSMIGVTGTPPAWERCTIHATAAAGFATGALFVKDRFSFNDRQEMTSILDMIREAFSAHLLNTEWMDDKTIDKALEKAKAIVQMIGYPDFIEDPAKLDDYYSNWTVDPLTTSFKNTYYSHTFLVMQALLKLRKPVDRTEWAMTPSTVNAYYSPNFNDIVFPAAILQAPLYVPGTPRSLLFGGVGAVMGHELSHAFDNQGRLYDKNGNLDDWWTAYSVKNFEDRTQCLINQYSKSEVAPGVFLNGLTTLGENIADNGGLKVSHQAWEHFLQLHPSYSLTLPGVNVTQEQLFFLGFGQLWCTYYTPKYAIQSTRTDVHSFTKYRVINTLRNLPSFSNAFKCPLGSGMNPIHKCSVW